MTLFIYKILSSIFLLFAYPFMLIRKYKHKETFESIKEKFCLYKVDNLFGKLIWINAASVGELNSIWCLVKELNKIKDINVLITTSSLTSKSVFCKNLNSLKNKDKVLHKFLPIDSPIIINKFLKLWKPDLFVNVESEFWPNLIHYTYKKCPILAINAKISKKSFRFWMLKINKHFRQQIFSCIDTCMAQTKENEHKFKLLGVNNTQYRGNIKFYVENTRINTELYENLYSQLNNKRDIRWLVNSTHEGEEEIILETHTILKKQLPNILTCIVLRHPNRNKDVIELLNKYNINYALASHNDKIANETEVYLYDILGSLSTLFKLFKIVFMSGSLLPHIGGHNPIEAAKESCAILTGPYIENNKILFKELQKSGGALILPDNKSQTLATVIKDLIQQNKKCIELANNAYYRTLQSTGLVDDIVNLIKSKIY